MDYTYSPWNSPGQDDGVAFILLQGIFATQGLNPGLPHRRQILYQLSHKGSPRDANSVPGLGRSPGEGYGNPLPYFCLENSMDRRAWWTTVHGVAKSWTRLRNLHFTSHTQEEGEDRYGGQQPIPAMMRPLKKKL